MKKVFLSAAAVLLFTASNLSQAACTITVNNIQADESAVVDAVQVEALTKPKIITDLMRIMGVPTDEPERPSLKATLDALGKPTFLLALEDKKDPSVTLTWKIRDGRSFYAYAESLCSKEMTSFITGNTHAYLKTPAGQMYKAIDDQDMAAIKDITRKYPATVNALDEEKYHSMLAVAVSQIEPQRPIIEWLLTHGADPKFVTSDGYNLLHLTVDRSGPCATQCLSIPKLLLKYGADLESKNHYGHTALAYAAMEGDAQEFENLLKLGADINVTYSDQSMPEFSQGETMLNMILSQPDKVKILLKYGLKITPQTIQNAPRYINQQESDGGIYYKKLKQSLALLKQQRLSH